MVCTWRRRARRPDMDAPAAQRSSGKIKYPSPAIESEYFQEAHRLNFGATYPTSRHGAASISPNLKDANKISQSAQNPHISSEYSVWDLAFRTGRSEMEPSGTKNIHLGH